MPNGDYTHVSAISIHAPLRGRPLPTTWKQAGIRNFNPRPLAGATFITRVYLAFPKISIHAPLRGRHTLLN